jgi:hypothetical protein
MRQLLRSILYFGHEDPILLLENFRNFVSSGLSFPSEEDKKVFKYLQNFVHTHNHLPHVETKYAHFQGQNELTLKDRIQVLQSLSPLYQGDFITQVEQQAEELRRRDLDSLINTMKSINNGTYQSGDVPLRGSIDAVRYFQEKSHAFVTPTFGSKLSGSVLTDTDDFRAYYERIEADPLATVGQHTAYPQIDQAFGGAKRQELWIHAAFTGHFKSQFTVNWAYNQAVYYRHSCLIFSLEMPYHQLRNIIIAMHSCHDKFEDLRRAYGIAGGEVSGLDYAAIRDGQLLPHQKAFLYDVVLKDLEDKSNGYGQIHIEVQNPDKMDFTVLDLKSKAEQIHAQDPIKMIFVDHAGLMASRGKYSSTTDRLNEVFRDLKRTAMAFSRGLGIAVVALTQINRECHKTAVKRKEKTGIAEYHLTDLSYANEAERSADIVTASWVDDDLRARCRVQFQALKSRDQALFKPFMMRFEPKHRRLFACYESPTGDSVAEESNINLEELDL